nr:MAG TPA: regulator of polyketide synthase expression [Caudoviricetes sp.]
MTHKFLTTLYHILVHKNTVYYRIYATLLYFLPAYFSR